MVRVKQCFAVAALLVIGHAAKTELQDGTPAAAAPAATRPAPAAVTPDLVVDVNQLAARAPEPVLCREVLKQGSNVHVIYCLTRSDWKRYKRAEADEAEELVRALQGGSYSTIYR
jgi:hypothetical protein